MKRETYMKEIERNLLCKKNKKAEICRELQSDIEAAMESGEEWETVEKRLGTPKELALELNENLSPQDKLKSGKLSGKAIGIIIGAVIICIIGVAAFFISRLPRSAVFGSSGLFEEEAVRAQAVAVIELASEDQWDELLDTYGVKVMQTKTVKESMIAAKQMLEPWGAYQKITSEYMYEVKVSGSYFAAVEMVVLYEERSVTYTLSFDSDMKLSGFYIK